MIKGRIFRQPGLIPIAGLAEILPTLNRISSWIESVFAYLSAEAINHGTPIPGCKVVEGRSKRVCKERENSEYTKTRHGQAVNSNQME